MKKTTLGVLILGAGLLLAGCGKQATSGQQSVSVGILQVVQHGSLDQARKGFKARHGGAACMKRASG